MMDGGTEENGKSFLDVGRVGPNSDEPSGNKQYSGWKLEYLLSHVLS